ncbi:hypothetical protein BP6252_06932 [Coleophoma cylindrospora]|uniref:laccase n=1 Tax=Coleophoma cylindrospora TaxID=1849047 RepID=A0A3D8RG48_9HELO|nr:hypothetical protein BP6252_06932 [Coleophoma cylindrospora]
MRLPYFFATLAFWLTLSTAYVTPSRGHSYVSPESLERGTSCNIFQIFALEEQILNIVREVECSLSTKITLPGFLGLLSNIFSNAACSTAEKKASVVTLREQAVPIWSSIENCLHTTLSMPSILRPTSTTTTKTTSSTKVVTTSASTSKSSAVNVVTSTSSSKASVATSTSATSLVISTSSSKASVVTSTSSTSLVTSTSSSKASVVTSASSSSTSLVVSSSSSKALEVSSSSTSSQSTTSSSTASLATSSSTSSSSASSSTTSLATASSTTSSAIYSTSSSATSASVLSSTSSITSSATTSSTSSTSLAITSSTSPFTNSSSSVTSSTSSSTISSALATGTPCAGNTASDRSVWCDYSTATDYYEEVPNTGVTREYWFDVTATTAAPDGFTRYVQLINGSLPGPTIFADWGDTVVLHVTNNVPNNGSSIHFHGIRQNYTNQNDGVPSLTQCPIAPGETYTYTWRATQYGTSWYHSHFALQAWEGVFGGIVINGPATANYDTDAGILFLNDWSHQTSDELYTYAQTTGPPQLDNALINGTNVFGEDGNSTQTGKRFEMSVVAGQSTRLRLVNGAIDTHFKFSVDNHTLTVMSTDFVPIVPYTTDILNIAIGQRYDVILTANQDAIASDFWMRAIPQVACSDNDSVDNIKGMVHYGSSTATPTTTGYAYNDECVDEPLASLVPYLPRNVNSSDISTSEAVTVATNTDNLFRWYLNSTTFVSDWANPTLLKVNNNVTTWTAENAVIEIPNAGEWLYIVVETQIPVPHPIHLHGHDFYVVAQGSTTYDPATVVLNRSNPPRRDVALLPASGYVVLAFEADNPGAWLMHCHIGWHTSEGFSLQFLEQASKIVPLLDVPTLEDTCSAWSSAATANSIVQEDSGV